jgi:hypothetical protein
VARRALRSLAAEDPEDLYYREGESASELLAALVNCVKLLSMHGSDHVCCPVCCMAPTSIGTFWRCSD